MTIAFRRDQNGGTTVEFAFIAPLMMLTFIGFVMLLYAIWLWSALEQVATETARCVAVGSATCTKVPSGCSAQDAGRCYLLSLAAQRGIIGVTSDAITINPASLRGTKPFTSVTVRYPFTVVGQTLQLKASGDFPNFP